VGDLKFPTGITNKKQRKSPVRGRELKTAGASASGETTRKVEVLKWLT
jgi:hypothetical protein